MPTITTLMTTASEVKRGDEVRLSRSDSWGTITKITHLKVNIEFTLTFDDVVGESTVRWNPNREVEVRRSEPTREEKRETMMERMQYAIDRFTPGNDDLEDLRAVCAENLTKRGPANYLKWNAADDAKIEHGLIWRLGVADWIEREVNKSTDPLDALAIGDIIVTALNGLRKQMTRWYPPHSTSAGSNMSEIAQFEAWREIVSDYGSEVEIEWRVQELHEFDAEQ